MIVDEKVRMVDGITIIGSALTDDDVSGIRKMIEAMPDRINKQILHIRHMTGNEVEVTAGVVRGPLDGSGGTRSNATVTRRPPPFNGSTVP